MGDPVVGVVRRTSEAYCRGQIPSEPYANTNSPGVDEISEFAAREALKPIRKKCEELDAMFGSAATDVAAGVRLVLTQLSPLIYTTEELMGHE